MALAPFGKPPSTASYQDSNGPGSKGRMPSSLSAGTTAPTGRPGDGTGMPQDAPPVDGARRGHDNGREQPILIPGQRAVSGVL